MYGHLERRVLFFYFILTFTMMFILILISWQIILLNIRQTEDDHLNSYIAQINNQITNYADTRRESIITLRESPRFLQAIINHDAASMNEIVNQSATPQFNGLYYIYNKQKDLISGVKFPAVEEHINEILFEDTYLDGTLFPVALGRDIFVIIYHKIFDDTDDLSVIGHLAYIEKLNLNQLNIPQELNPVLFSSLETLEQFNVSERNRQFFSFLRKEIQNLTNLKRDKSIFRLNIDTAGGILIEYDVFSNPAMHIFFTYTRQLNQFAHRGLLALTLFLMSLALLMITFTGSWFRARIIAPVKDVSLKMTEIESNPASLKPIMKKYGGILGEMINTFNCMNQSLYNFNNSLKVYKDITDNLDSGILWMDNSLTIILCNPSILSIFNKQDTEEVIGKNLTDLIPFDEDTIHKAKTVGLYIPQLEIKNDDYHRYIRLVLFRIKEVDEQSEIRYIASIYDVTKETQERKARELMEFELIKSNRLADVGRLAEGIVHNINSPLNAVVGYAQLLKKNYPDNNDIERILKAGNNISISVKKLLNKVKEDSISMIRPLDINNLVSLELDLCTHNIFFSQNVKLIKELKPLHKSVYATHGDISISFVSLVNNAIQSMRKTDQKILTVVTDEDDRWITIQIIDTGEGIPENDISKLFDPDYTTKKEIEGAGFGLGLAISKNIIEKYKGKITVESMVGKGSIFTIYLPNVDDENFVPDDL